MRRLHNFHDARSIRSSNILFSSVDKITEYDISFQYYTFYYDNNHIFHRETITLNSIVTFFLTTKSILLI